ncbi:MAG: hypothetical protein P1P64_03080 [Treponemataceae bacterium]
MAIIYATILVGADRRSFEYADRFQIDEVDARSKTKITAGVSRYVEDYFC